MKNLRNMFKKTFSIICLLLFSLSVLGQEETGKMIKFGVKFGTTISSFSSAQPHNNYKPGYIAGGFLSYKLSGNLALQVEPSYMQQGGNLIEIVDPGALSISNYPFAYEVKDHKITYHNIDIPILLKYEKGFQGVTVFGLIGPSIGMNLRASQKTDVSARSWGDPPVFYNYYSDDNITSNIDFFQFGVTSGIGIEAPLGKHTLIFDIKYRYSINKTYKGYSYIGINQVKGDLLSNTLYFTLGFGF